eukprot:scaffold1042_cov401-Prasinococcus_capsulatus_cf.AAC.3
MRETASTRLFRTTGSPCSPHPGCTPCFSSSTHAGRVALALSSCWRMAKATILSSSSTGCLRSTCAKSTYLPRNSPWLQASIEPLLVFLCRRSPEGSSNQSEMNIEEFLTFLLAVKNRESPQSLSYFFQILDLEGQGYITGKEIHIFFREVHSKWIASETTELLQDDVTDEVFDMVGPARADRIYRRDLMVGGRLRQWST